MGGTLVPPVRSPPAEGSRREPSGARLGWGWFLINLINLPYFEGRNWCANVNSSVREA